jgi:phospholipase C
VASDNLTRRNLLRTAGAGALALSPAARATLAVARSQHRGPRHVRKPNSLPFPGRPAGEVNEALPFDHVVVVMMENHSFDCYLGMLPRRGQRKADGFTFNRRGVPMNRNPLKGGYVLPYRATSTCQASVTQSWNSTHKQINGGRMNGFAKTAPQSMVYWTEDDLPFYYSLARTFTLANRWFGSAPCQTYPNRRFLLAGTAYGLISTDTSSLEDPPPANGTLFDRLDRYGVGWKNYFTDLPGTGVIPSIPEGRPENLATVSQFHADCAAGNLPAVSFVDPEFGVAGEVGGPLSTLPIPDVGQTLSTQGGDEENPQDIQIGQSFMASVVGSVLSSPAWRRTLLVWLYDEHGGYYDHVPPPRAIKPDSIPPKLGPGDVAGGYDIYGPRVPAVVVSAHSRPRAVDDTVCDHTSILATIEAKWNLPACTYRDANAKTVESFLDPRREAFAEPPKLAAAPDPAPPGDSSCSTDDPPLVIHRRHHPHRRRRSAEPAPG